MKRIIALIFIPVLCAGLLVLNGRAKWAPELWFGSTPDTPLPASTADMPEQTVYFLNSEPVLQMIYEQLSQEYYQMTGIRVKPVVSEEQLGGDAPVLFSVSDETELGKWPCLDLYDSVVYGNLACGCFTLNDGEKIYGVAAEAEPLGLIYNTALLARVGYTGADIGSFAELSAVAAYITANEEQLGFGAFANIGDGTRIASLLAAIPHDVSDFWELYSTYMSSGDIYGQEAVFCLGTVSDMQYMSAGGDLQLEMISAYSEKDSGAQGLYCFARQYWCVNEDAPREQIEAALAFLGFLVSPRADGTVPVDDLAILSPFRQAQYAHCAVQQQFRSDIARGKVCTVCGPERPAPESYTRTLLRDAATK